MCVTLCVPQCVTILPFFSLDFNDSDSSGKRGSGIWKNIFPLLLPLLLPPSPSSLPPQRLASNSSHLSLLYPRVPLLYITVVHHYAYQKVNDALLVLFLAVGIKSRIRHAGHPSLWLAQCSLS